MSLRCVDHLAQCDSTDRLEQAAAAVAYAKTHQARGKVVVSVRPA